MNSSGRLIETLHRHSLLLIAPVFLTLNLYVIASWHMWWFGGSYGHRGFVEALSILSISMASFFR